MPNCLDKVVGDVLDIDRRYLGAAAGLILLLVFFGGMKYGEMKNRNHIDQEMVAPVLSVNEEPDKKSPDDIIQVYVTGAVEKPGVYRLQSGARVFEAVDMARSLPTANLPSINLAQKVEDGQAIVVPTIGEDTPINVPVGGATLGIAPAKPGNGGKVNINTASVQDLDGLPGIGPTIAARIIDYRTSHGAFANIEDLNEVSGIGDKKFADIKDLVTVR